MGINLPPDLLKSLTESAGAISASGEGHAITSENLKQLALSIKSSEGATSTAKWEREKKSDGLKLTGGKSDASSSRPASVASSASSGAQLESTPPEVSALRKTAEEAVAAISRKRYLDDARATCGNGSDSNSNKPSYNKRRKRPRLVDIESRLEKLREENKLLKQHLDNVTSQTKKFDEERAKTEEAMKRMMMEAEGASDEELNAVIRDYTEMYSDYGKRRHQELSFHLEQLQK